jgi:hypothetical protein
MEGAKVIFFVFLFCFSWDFNILSHMLDLNVWYLLVFTCFLDSIFVYCNLNLGSADQLGP